MTTATELAPAATAAPVFALANVVPGPFNSFSVLLAPADRNAFPVHAAAITRAGCDPIRKELERVKRVWAESDPKAFAHRKAAARLAAHREERAAAEAAADRHRKEADALLTAGRDAGEQERALAAVSERLRLLESRTGPLEGAAADAREAAQASLARTLEGARVRLLAEAEAFKARAAEALGEQAGEGLSLFLSAVAGVTEAGVLPAGLASLD
jgi:hypothetical protein